jgi:hypothetical protein
MASEVGDIFEELRTIDSKMAASDGRRFSFSVPPGDYESSTVDGFDFISSYDKSYDPLYDSNGDDGYTAEYYIGEDSLERLEAEVKEEEEREMEVGVVKMDLADPISKLVSAGRADKKFKIPSLKVKDAQQIWISADIGDIASYNEIETKLLKWAEKCAEIRCEKKGHGLIITWKSASGCVCTAKWYSFIRWILCASLTDTAPK